MAIEQAGLALAQVLPGLPVAAASSEAFLGSNPAEASQLSKTSDIANRYKFIPTPRSLEQKWLQIHQTETNQSN